MKILITIISILITTSSAFAETIQIDRLVDTRYCGTPNRNADGTITRSTTVLNAFKKIHPCPSTLLSTGPCPRWHLNHAIPRACGGCDSVSNLFWAPVEIKTCKEDWCIDRFERKIYGIGIPGTEESCPIFSIK